MRSLHISVVLERDAGEVYAFAADPDNLPRWAAGLAQSDVRREGSALVTHSPMGEVSITFAPQNAFGVLDHDVRLPSGQVVHNPLRVVTHPQGSEVVFTLRQRDLTDEEFERDAAAVRQDLEQLRALLDEGV
ncbi:SRPBCC family protein [Nesterenkonia sp. NBAIMH1]|uniref:SRPBCC family protein n=1 Tax=Nesterenkonia sp. NBAIMH1 TaxID=2600320 RepID=UPI0011B3C0A1|nr:SRPBCC family protein [Nesterenkonia sp. NBAIMH1]